MQATRPHQANPEPKLIISKLVNDKDVLLSYYKRPQLKAGDIVSIENIYTGSYDYEPERIVEMFPNAAGVLCDDDWNTEHECTWAEITDVFLNGVPLFYVYVCKLLSATADVGSIMVKLRDGRPLPGDCLYLITTEPEGKGYRVLIYTNFTRDDDYIVKYTAVDESGEIREHEEDLCPYPVGIISQQEIPDLAGRTYFISPGSNYGTKKITVTDGLIKEERRPTFFKYRLRVDVTENDGAVSTYYSPWKSDYVYHPDSILPFDTDRYVNGRKMLTNKSAAEIMKAYYGDIFSGKIAVYSAESDNSDVKVMCRIDGEGAVYAYTEKQTGKPNIELTKAGRKWKIIDLTKQNLERIGAQVGERQLRLIITGTKDGQRIYSSVFNVANEYNFDSTSLSIRPADVAALPADTEITIDLEGNTTGIDMQVYLGGMPYPGKTVTAGQIVNAGGLTITIAEIYRLHCFVRIYAVRLIKRQLDVAIKDNTEESPWFLSIKRGAKIVPIDADRFYVYEVAMPDVIPAVEAQPEAINPDTIMLKKKPIVAGISTTGAVLNVRATQNGKPLDIEYCDAFSGIIKFKYPVSSSRLIVEYQYIAEDIEYKGFNIDSAHYRLDLNPACGHYCKFDSIAINEVPTWSLIGKDIFICATPAAVINYNHSVTQELIKFVKYERVDGRLAVRMKLAQKPIKWEDTKIYRYRDGEEISYKNGQAYWIEAYDSETEILIVDPDMQIDPFGRIEEIYCADYSYISNVPQVERIMKPTIYHSLNTPDEESHIVLAKVRLSFPYTVEDMKLIDARKRGGGIKESLIEKAHTIEPESRHYFDIGYWDGEPWQRNGLIQVILPRKLKDMGYSDEFIKERVERFKAAGVFPLIDFWDGSDTYPSKPGHIVINTVDLDEDNAKIGIPRHIALSLIFEFE